MTANKPLLTLSAADIMSHSVIMLPPAMSLQGAARLLARARVTGAPVVDEAGHCVGVLSATDFMHWVERDQELTFHDGPSDMMCKPWQMSERLPICRVEDFMTREPILVSPGTRIGELARQMMDAHIHRVIVVDVHGRPIGVVSSIDILAAVARADQSSAEAESLEHAMAGPHF
jgi:CBS domain-containing protein